MAEFINWSTLGTYGGALAMVMLITQFAKDISFVKKVPTQLLSYIMAFIVLIFANVFTTGISVDVIAQTFLNSIIVSVAANGGYMGIKRLTGNHVDGELLIDDSDPNKDKYRFEVGSIDDLSSKNTITLVIKTDQKL